MDHPYTLTPALPTEDHCVRLGGDAAAFLDQIDRLGTLYLQARNTGGGLGMVTTANALMLDAESGIALDPDNNLSVQVDDLIAIHAVQTDPLSGATPGFDLEFASQCAGLSYYSVPGLSPMEEFFGLITEFPGQATALSHLKRWRDDISLPVCQCGECEVAGLARAQAPTAHPIHDILTSLVDEGSPVQCRMLAEHTDLTTWITPGSVIPEDGFLCMADRDGSAVLTVDLRFLHALRISFRTLDNQKFAALEIYDSQGTLNFEILSPEPSLAPSWQFACERSNYR